MSCGHGRLPDLALLHLAVAKQDVDVEVVAKEPRPERHAEACRERVAERAGAEVDSRDARHVRMVAERIAQPRVLVEHLLREEVPVGEDRVEPDRGVALAQAGSGRGRASPVRRAAAA